MSIKKGNHMKTLILGTVISTLFSAASFATPYSYNAGYTDTPPTIDGLADDQAWKSAQETSRFVFHQDNSFAPVGTWAKLTYDNENLYLLYIANDEDIVVNYSGHDHPTYESDDTVEVFLDPDGDGKNYYEIGATLTASYDEVIISTNPWEDDDPWNVKGLEYAVTYLGTPNDNSDKDSHFIIEMKIPLSSLNYIGNDEYKNKQWRFNFFRAEYSTDSPTWEPNGWLSWSPVGSFGFHQPEKFAFLNFTDVPLWKEQSYNNLETVSFKGKTYEARFHSENAPGLSSTDGWRLIDSEAHEYSDSLFYAKGDEVVYHEKVWIANWNTQGQNPSNSPDWSLKEK